MTEMTLEQASEFFTKTMTGYRTTKVLLVGNQLRVFELLDESPRTPAEVADLLGCDQAAMTNLLRALAAIQLLEVRGDRFGNASLASTCLVSGKPGYMGNILRFQEMLWDNWSNLESVVRTGKPWKSLPELLGGQDQSFTREYIRGMHRFSAPSAREVAAILTRTASRPMRRMLDIGGGPGTYALALLERDPDLAATILDLPTTLAVTHEINEASPHRGRLELKPGNYLEDDYGCGYDLALMSHVTHDESEDAVEHMVRAAFAALAGGGRVAIHDWIVDETGAQPVSSAMFSVNVMVYTNGGRIYSREEYARILARAGFTNLSSHTVLENAIANPTSLIIGEKEK